MATEARAERISKPRTKETLMTPESALAILERFQAAEKKGEAANRPVSDGRVEMLKRAILDGCWKLTHQGIAIDYNGILIDGQHRLWAIVEAKTAVPILVTTDADPETMPVIDRGRSRSLGNVLHLLGESYGGTKASIARILGAFLAGNGSSDPKFYRQSDEQVINTVSAFKDDIDWFISKRRPGAFSSAPLAAVMVFAHRSFPKELSELSEKFIGGLGLSKGDPIHTLREKIIGDTSDVLLRRYPSKITLMRYSWNAFAHGVRREPLFRVNDSLAGYEFFRSNSSKV